MIHVMERSRWLLPREESQGAKRAEEPGPGLRPPRCTVMSQPLDSSGGIRQGRRAFRRTGRITPATPTPPQLRLSPPEPALGISQMTFRAQGPPLTFPCLFLPDQMQCVGPASCLVPPASSPCQVQPGYRATGEPTRLPAGSGLAAPAP